MREYSNYDIKVYQEVISLYKNGFKPTYKLICLIKTVSFIEFRKYVKDTYGYDPDDKDVEFSNKLLKKSKLEFIRKFVEPYGSIYADYKSLDLYVYMYKVIKENNLDYYDRKLFSKLNAINSKVFTDRKVINKLKLRYSLFSSIPIS
jgi:hypothetical protein